MDFETKTIEVSPKSDIEETWEWQSKDTDRRTLPLTEELVSRLAVAHGLGKNLARTWHAPPFIGKKV